MPRFVTLATFNNAIDAHIVKALLESEQITVFFARRAFFGTQKLLNVALADIRLQVLTEHFSHAKQLLVDYKAGTLAEPLVEIFDLKARSCKACGSEELQEISARPSLIFDALFQMFFIGMVLPPSKLTICKQCKTEFKEE